MLVEFEKITLLEGMLKFNPILFFINIILIVHFIIEWFIFYKKTKIVFDYWRFFCVLNIFIPIFIMYPFSSSIYNILSTGNNIFYIEPFVDQANIISIFGYIFLLLGRFLCKNRISNKLNFIEAILYNNLRSDKFYKLLYILTIIFVSIMLVYAQKYPAYIFNFRSIRYDEPIFGAFINFLMSYSIYAMTMIGIRFFLKPKISILILLILVMTIPILIGTRSGLFTPIITILLILSCYYKEKIKIWYYIIGFTIIIILVMLLAVIRASIETGIEPSSIFDFNIFLLGIFYGNSFSDLRDFAWTLSGFNEYFLWGKTYLSAVLSFVPSAIFEYRELYSYGAVTNYFAGISGNHFGLRIGVFGEIYINFGYVGEIIICIFMGYLLQYTNNNFLNAILNKKDICLSYTRTIGFTIFSMLFLNSSGFFMIYVLIIINVLGLIVRKIKF